MHRYVSIVALFPLAACDPAPEDGRSVDVTTDEDAVLIEGVVHKGPFLRGSTVTVHELVPDDLAQTGLSFSSTVFDASGSFEVVAEALEGPYVRIGAEGFYFQEVWGRESSAPISLTSLSELGDEPLNVNVLTHLQTPRVEYLVLEEGYSFEEAKMQAYAEVLDVFLIDLPWIEPAESLSVTGSNFGDSALLAASAMLSARMSTPQVSEHLARIADDIREDGVLDDADIRIALTHGARVLDKDRVRDNLVERYGVPPNSILFPVFNALVENYLDLTLRAADDPTYPSSGICGPNLLAPGVTEVQAEAPISIAANPAIDGMVRIEIEVPEPHSVDLFGNGYYFEVPYPDSLWGTWSGQVYTGNVETGVGVEEADLCISLGYGGSWSLGDLEPYTATIRIYENDNPQPARVHEVTVGTDAVAELMDQW